MTDAKPHRWMGLGWMPLTWIDVDEMLSAETQRVEFEDSGPELRMTGVFCIVCDAPYASDSRWCPGLPPSRPNDHHYVSLANFLMTEEEARAWDEDRLEEIPQPRTLLMTCWFCGEPGEDPSSDCPERSFWIDKDWQGSWSEAEILWDGEHREETDEPPSRPASGGTPPTG